MDNFSGQPENSEELIFGFTEELMGEGSWSSSSSTTSVEIDDGAITDEENENDENSTNAEEESKAFWESQEDLLTTTLFRTTSMESKIRQATKDAMKEMNLGGFICCVCDKKKIEGTKSCQDCLHREISGRLRMEGYNCNIRKSKWRNSSDIPSGDHTYLEVVQNTSSGKGAMKIIIEPNFKAQFEMARASEEYKRLINKLPEVFVGKFCRLQNSVKILCAALKKSMKENKMHMAPWRKHKYMLAKWQGSPDNYCYEQYQLKMTPNMSPVISHLGRSTTRPRASLLTFDLLDTLRVIPSSTMIKVG
ncbi:OLC1v1023956C1 [Oldenlandia corymbosa var. corymbosa]|uniref:OLC1v1023956C1 n=1 Tax=Oldenlandia corymbosa var. corymbosa TaxID=529605 RepID=A0AAV1C1P7_OLDCO|nr:OLC1v1023956C1 [Oldenlandia corymbosa var. corymbosa]